MPNFQGTYVNTFAEASHALPEGMHMNADYPFMIPAITAKTDKTVTIEGRGGQTATFRIQRKNGREFGVIRQSSSFEMLFHRKPTRFVLWPALDSRVAP